ncbi:MAG: HDOD domain-containing protein [Rhodocyclaceae bacterium]|nr:HDOD domain-containing protein [Rhodocyclaceae bacterium]
MSDLSLAHADVRIPPQPAVLARLFELLAAGECDIRRVAQVIAGDAGLAALLFRLAASPIYAKGRRADSLERVLQVVGVQQSFNLARALALEGAIGGDRRVLEVFWQRSGDIARIAAEVASDRVAVCNVFPDQAYLAAIFQDCGVPLLAERFPDYGSLKTLAVGAACWASMVEEDRRYSTDHCVVGYLVARHWKLPDFVADAIRCHHELVGLGEHRVRSLVAILMLAQEIYCREHGIHNAEWFGAADLVMSELGLDPAGLDEYCDEIRDRCHAAG